MAAVIVLLSFENVDEATAPIQSRLHKLFLTLALVCVLVAFLCSVGSSSSIVKPIAAVVSHLRNAVRTGKLPELRRPASSILEIQELAEIYNRAAVSVRAAGENLEAAYLEFVGSLANALDARDQYTAGHSAASASSPAPLRPRCNSVQTMWSAFASARCSTTWERSVVADSVLQKPGRLTDEEFALVKQHPVIGRRILEGVQGFAPFLRPSSCITRTGTAPAIPRGNPAKRRPSMRASSMFPMPTTP